MGLSWTVKISSLLGILFVLQALGCSSSVEEGDGEAVPLRWGQELLDNQDEALDAEALFSSGTGNLSGSSPSESQESVDAGDLVRFVFDWGDGTISETEFVDPGTVVGLSHAWMSEGVYSVRVRAEDVHGASSEWSEAMDVTIVQRVKRFVGLRRPSVS